MSCDVVAAVKTGVEVVQREWNAIEADVNLDKALSDEHRRIVEFVEFAQFVDSDVY